MDIDNLIRQAVNRAAAPIAEALQRQQGVISGKAADHAAEGLREALEVYAPQIAHRADDADFRAQFRELAQGLPLDALSNPQAVAAAALGLLAYSAPARHQAPVYGLRRATPAERPAPSSPNRSVEPSEAVDPRFTDIHGNPLHTLDAYKAAKARQGGRKR